MYCWDFLAAEEGLHGINLTHADDGCGDLFVVGRVTWVKGWQRPREGREGKGRAVMRLTPLQKAWVASFLRSSGTSV